MLRLAFDFIITWRETRTRPNAYQIGVKWGLRTAERILIPPVYRRILHPVGGYCAYQDSSCQWGVLAVDGRIIIRARYMEVEIDRDGTARLTLVPGKMETVKLTD